MTPNRLGGMTWHTARCAELKTKVSFSTFFVVVLLFLLFLWWMLTQPVISMLQKVEVR